MKLIYKVKVSKDSIFNIDYYLSDEALCSRRHRFNHELFCEFWFKNKGFHRLHLPAIIWENKDVEYWEEGLRLNE